MQFTAKLDASLQARVTGSIDMVYADGSDEEHDRPAHVLAASGLSAFREYLAVVQDDANWLALIDRDQKVTAVPLPPGRHGERIFTKSRGNQDQKYDFEACIAMPGEGGPELIGFASGSREDRFWILRVCERDAAHRPAPGSREWDDGMFHSEFVNAERFYAMLRGETEFCGAGLNIEGAVALDDERIMLFQRGNADPCADLQPVDSTVQLSWSELRRYLADPEHAPLPELREIRCYQLGELGGVRLTFSDAEHLGDGRIVYSASAEDPETDEIAGSVLGVLEADGQARWTKLADEDGEPFRGKIEGLTRDVHDERKVHFVIDDDDDSVPSRIYQAELSAGFFTPR